jgi:hypothetical protein
MSMARLATRLVASTESGAREAMRVASVIAASSSASGSWTSLTSPLASAPSASTGRPVSSMTLALATPIMRGSRQAEAISPTFTPAAVKIALVDASRMSLASATSSPPPTQWPFTAAITGARKASSWSSMALKSATAWGVTAPFAAASRKSSPVQKVLPRPVSTTARTVWSASSASSSATILARMAEPSALAGGLTITIRTTPCPGRL